jgi:flagellin-like protein
MGNRVSFSGNRIGETQMKSKLLRRGIEPIIAVVILVAVTLVIAIGVIGWIMGWWGTFGATEALQFYADSAIVYSTNANAWLLQLHLKNTGSASAVIYKIEISGIKEPITSQFTTGSGASCPNQPGPASATEVTVGPGSEICLAAPIPQGETIVAGANYLVKIYTRAGNVYSVTVQAKS